MQFFSAFDNTNKIINNKNNFSANCIFTFVTHAGCIYCEKTVELQLVNTIKTKMDNRQKLKNKYSAKVKDIFIELFGYTYFHDPSKIDHVDRRLIGRDKIKRKIRSILTDTESKSGAYLVTGFRGMGKTSLVNSFLNGIQGKNKDSDTFNQYLCIFITVLALAVLSLEVYILSLIITIVIFV